MGVSVVWSKCEPVMLRIAYFYHMSDFFSPVNCDKVFLDVDMPRIIQGFDEYKGVVGALRTYSESIFLIFPQRMDGGSLASPSSWDGFYSCIPLKQQDCGAFCICPGISMQVTIFLGGGIYQ